MPDSDKLRSTLKKEVLEKERLDSAEQTQKDRIDALTAALTETTSLDNSKITAVVANLKEEAVNGARTLQITLPSPNSKYIRIALYLIAGVFAFSIFKSGQLESIEQEQYYDNINAHPKYDFFSDLSSLKMMLSGSYFQHFHDHNAFPGSAGDLGKSATRYLDNSRFIQSYVIKSNGTIKLGLSDQYGYHRFIELEPKQQSSLGSWHIEFDCRSNALDHLLHDKGRYWCDPT